MYYFGKFFNIGFLRLYVLILNSVKPNDILSIVA